METTQECLEKIQQEYQELRVEKEQTARKDRGSRAAKDHLGGE